MLPISVYRFADSVWKNLMTTKISVLYNPFIKNKNRLLKLITIEKKIFKEEMLIYENKNNC